MNSYRRSAFWIRLALPFVALMVVGSLALALLQRRAYVRELRRDLSAIATAHADFLRSTAFPPSAQLARNFSRLLNAQVFFRYEGDLVPAAPTGESAALIALPADSVVRRVSPDLEALAVDIGHVYALVIGRRVEDVMAQLGRPSFLLPLGFLATMAGALAWLLARGVVVPLQALAERLPKIADAPADARSLPGLQRTDAVGLVARTFLRTSNALHEERARREKAERLAMIGRMSTGLAHEIQNPVAAIKMHAQLLQTTPAGQQSAALARSMPHILDGASRIESLVQQWMFLARPQPPALVRVGLGDLLGQCLGMMGPMLRHAGVIASLDVATDLSVMADRQRLLQVAHNLIANAVQAMSGPGRLVVSARPTASGVIVRFHDSGPGFSANALEHARDLFFSEREGGMGVGLNVCDEIVRAHGGTLRLSNDPSGGAVVEIELPSGEVAR